MTTPDLILINGRFTTLDPSNPAPQAVAIAGEHIVAVGDSHEILASATGITKIIDLKGHRVTPGLIDSHIHIIRGGLNYNLELRWDGVPSLSDAMSMLRQQAQVTPPGQWVRVVGGFTEHQFAEKRLPTLDELNAAAPDTPVFILHLYDRALLNRAALRAVGYDSATPNPLILYATLAKGPKADPDQQLNSTRHFMREMNRLGVTSVIDAGGGFQNYPDDYAVIEKLHADGQLTLRIAYNLFTQKKGEEVKDFSNWAKIVKPGQGDNSYRHNGAGEMLVFSAADFEDFREPRPELAPEMEGELEAVTRVLAENRWPWRLHATYNETIERALTVFEKVNKEIPFNGLHWFFDHAETISPRNIDRIAALGGGIAVQHRMAFQGEDFIARYGHQAAEITPPVKRILEAGVPLGAGTDATRVASYNPWVSLSWLVTGKTVGGASMYPAANRLSREQALDLWTRANTWFSSEQGKKGQIKVGQLADLAVLSADYFHIAESEIAGLESVLTVLGGKVVYGAGPFSDLSPPIPPVIPDWSPVKTFGGYQHVTSTRPTPTVFKQACGCAKTCAVHGHDHAKAWMASAPVSDQQGFWGAFGCACWAV
jgi:predicted amidohydrolase YtcJ